MPPTVRPLSPHLQVYRWQIQMATSILHRATGVILFIGSLLIAAALLALASGAEAWSCVTGLAGSWFGLTVLFGWTWALAYHWLNGIRHLLQDAGWGFSIASFVANGWISVIGSFVLTGLVWTWVYCCGGIA
ncbi:MAG: succinate dehydrogenase, cytochrome b556 subunit [Dokdonella sp.]|uniref:succinate dehydrogenase, cytochrome b556 subunit n=1 Tax=Dokdonella sp. TaxID=2291710 RepID=UPI002CD2583D|nr:succinate dehydrogenase, cytochrome b556 subunit [Dokdonella sp.]HOX71374.1 succinate dehydrogenase, cytochrome b556 subunit [Dokdonella sp.]HPG94074.1 succinate dehydrogenase, cytochrome b556 subunit [Dokdonella sp.]HPN79447.1 succinate dehydrogenase, cytochrome b556 subunit [Dokdonella sp.]